MSTSNGDIPAGGVKTLLIDKKCFSSPAPPHLPKKLKLNSIFKQPSIKTLTAICQAFGITLSEFFADGKKGSERSAQDDELLRRVNALGSEEKNALLVIVKAMTDR